MGSTSMALFQLEPVLLALLLLESVVLRLLNRQVQMK